MVVIVLAKIVIVIRAGRQNAVLVLLTVKCVTSVDLGLVRKVVIDPIERVPAILRITAAGIGRHAVAHMAEHGSTGRDSRGAGEKTCVAAYRPNHIQTRPQLPIREKE